MARAYVLAAILGLPTLMALSFIARQMWIDTKIADARGLAGSIRVPPAGPPSKRDDRPTVLLLGDSRLSRWTPTQGRDAWDFQNRAVGGETVAQLAQRFQAEVRHFRPTQIVVSSGINDIVGISFMSAAQSDAAIAALVSSCSTFAEQARQAGARMIMTTIVPPSTPGLLRRLVWSARTMDLVRQANRALRNQPWPPNTILLDLDRAFQPNRDGYLPPQYRQDTLHMNKEGYLLYGRQILDALASTSKQTIQH